MPYIYINVLGVYFYPKRLTVHSSYTSVRVIQGIGPTTFDLLVLDSSTDQGFKTNYRPTFT